MPILTDNLRTLHASLVITALVIAALVLGADLLIPLAIATILSFILSPIVKKLVRWRLPRSLAVAIVLGGGFFSAVSLTAVLSTQILTLTAELQTYRENLVEKARWVSSFGQGTTTLQRASDAVEAIDDAIRREFDDPTKQTGSPRGGITTTPASPPAAAAEPAAQPAEAEPNSLMAIFDKLAGPGTTFALTLLFTMFLLLQYEDIRDRIIRLAGTENLSGTTAAMSDAGSRLSKLFLTQAVLNVTFGIVTGIVLAVIGVPNPILWGVVSAIARFIPYVGSLIAAVPPIILAAGVDPGWNTALLTAAFFLTAEPVMGHVVEPAVLGRSIGLSPFAMVISASFWVLIWGPIGLILAAPLTLLLVVMGGYVPRLEFASVLLGDQRALEPHLDLYRRILSGDTAAAIAQMEEEVEEQGLAASVDGSLLPALRHAASDQRRGRIDELRRNEITETVDDVVDFLVESVPAPASPEQAQRVLVVAARGPFDELTAKVTAAVLDKSPRINAESTAGTSGLTALATRKVEDGERALDAIVLTTAGGVDSRLLGILAKRTQQQFPNCRVHVLEAVEPGFGLGRPGLPEGIALYRSVAEAMAALDFEPTRNDRPAASPPAPATATAA
jgi:predicted PurR-regulated permease PerM